MTTPIKEIKTVKKLAGASLIMFGALALAGCQTEDTGVRAAKMEMQDDAACKGRPDYTQCWKNLFAYRQQAVIEENQRQARMDRVADGLAEAGRSLQNINPPPPPPVNVNVTCTFGCR
jgi:hypothetical protein